MWLAAARAERTVHGAVNDPTVQDWLAAVNDGVRPAIGFDIPKDVGSPLILIFMLDPGVLTKTETSPCPWTAAVGTSR